MAETPQKQIWTIQSMRRWACDFFGKNGIDTPQLDADILLADALGVPRIQLLIDGAKELDADTLARFKALVIRRTRQHEPIAYILGKREFWSLDLKVTPDTLIPRPDTECLVEAVLEAIRTREQAKAAPADVDATEEPATPEASTAVTYEALPDERLASYIELWTKQDEEADVSEEDAARRAAIPEYDEDGNPMATRDIHADVDIPPARDDKAPIEEASVIDAAPHDGALRIIDIGTGSGAIAIALASELSDKNVDMYAVDISAGALAVAQDNAKQLGFSRIHFVQSDLLQGVTGNFDVIVSNPPYVTTDEYAALSAEVKHEPKLALIAGKDGLDIYERLIPQAFERLRDDGLLAVEIGCLQADAVMGIFRRVGLSDVTSQEDYAGKPRIVMGRKKNPHS